MRYKKKNSWLPSIIIALLIISLPPAFMYIKSLSDSDNVEEVRKKMKKHLYEKYGEEFVVDRIGTQTADGDTDYVARIYPKSIVGTIKEGDPYYYAKAGADKEPFGGVGAVGDGYEIVQLNIEAEKYLMQKAKQIFGNRIKLKTDVKYEKRKEGNDYFSWQLVTGFKELLNKANTDPENHRIQLELYLYIFDRIDNEEEKEKRRNQIFDFVQYLKDEGLFEYLEMRIVIVDERVLADSYDDFKWEIEDTYKVRKYIEDEDVTVKLPPMELRKQMSRQLQKEASGMSEEELLKNMQKISKSELNYKEIGKWNGQYLSRIYSPGIIKERYTSTYNQNSDIVRYFENIDDVGLAPILNYVYE
ncbi:hypothetical protein [Selenihalanaerobacter shriftii]|uniref:Uncharacterized protein n=1 Tax=Selenihalanaerobacter shriftii TaxID=142842 RepID=A0A1T4QHY3_9FIRM|nr:hypothetical protein [Selenihalanaerobacter shriftii]SKA03314.1 hypothetical protein SAMN02745118_02572 [Selenihalanaerobacter shriftii]